MKKDTAVIGVEYIAPGIDSFEIEAADCIAASPLENPEEGDEWGWD